MDIYFLGRTPQRTTGTVTRAIASSEKYAGYQIDDADFVETPTKENIIWLNWKKENWK